MKNAQIKIMSNSSLIFAIKDLIETIEIQEKSGFDKGTILQQMKLAEYHNDLYMCVCEKKVRNLSSK